MLRGFDLFANRQGETGNGPVPHLYSDLDHFGCRKTPPCCLHLLKITGSLFFMSPALLPKGMKGISGPSLVLGLPG